MSDFKLKILCLSWIVVISSIMLYMNSWYQISFNFSESNFSKSDILNQIELAENNLIHIVAPAGGCSNVVLRMLTENSRPNSKVKEFVFLIDAGDELNKLVNSIQNAADEQIKGSKELSDALYSVKNKTQIINSESKNFLQLANDSSKEVKRVSELYDEVNSIIKNKSA